MLAGGNAQHRPDRDTRRHRTAGDPGAADAGHSAGTGRRRTADAPGAATAADRPGRRAAQHHLSGLLADACIARGAGYDGRWAARRVRQCRRCGRVRGRNSARHGGAQRCVADDRAIEVRIGLNLGEVIVEGDDRYGEGVNVAARLEQLAEPGGIWVSGKVAREVEKNLPSASSRWASRGSRTSRSR